MYNVRYERVHHACLFFMLRFISDMNELWASLCIMKYVAHGPKIMYIYSERVFTHFVNIKFETNDVRPAKFWSRSGCCLHVAEVCWWHICENTPVWCWRLNFTQHINSIDAHNVIKFTSKTQTEGKLPFLDLCMNILDDGGTIYRNRHTRPLAISELQSTPSGFH